MTQRSSSANRPRRDRADAPPASALPVDSLAFALQGAATAIGAVRAGSALPAALLTLFAERGEGEGRAPAQSTAASEERGHWQGAVQDIAYRTLRGLGLVDAILAVLVPKPPAPPVRDLLAGALALLVLAVEEPEKAPYEQHTIVDQAVTAAGAAPQTHFARGMVNAVLRNFLREAPALCQQARRDPAALWNYPRWWIDAVKRAWPNDWQQVLRVGNTQAPMTLRVNRRHTSPDAYLKTLAEAGIDGVAAGADGVRLTRALPVQRLPGFQQGIVSVQDAGAQRAASLLGVVDGMRVLDACAAPGGKTGHLLELADISVVALESDSTRARRIDENLLRLAVRAEIKVGDAGDPALPWWDGQMFDRILADVPCSASGIVRRHPDIRWLRRASDIPALVETQRRILQTLWQTLKPGGEMLYVTCSIFPEEGEKQACWFEHTQEDAVRLDAPGQLTPTVALQGADADHDGFFYARFQKR